MKDWICFAQSQTLQHSYFAPAGLLENSNVDPNKACLQESKVAYSKRTDCAWLTSLTNYNACLCSSWPTFIPLHSKVFNLIIRFCVQPIVEKTFQPVGNLSKLATPTCSTCDTREQGHIFGVYTSEAETAFAEWSPCCKQLRFEPWAPKAILTEIRACHTCCLFLSPNYTWNGTFNQESRCI